MRHCIVFLGLAFFFLSSCSRYSIQAQKPQKLIYAQQFERPGTYNGLLSVSTFKAPICDTAIVFEQRHIISPLRRSPIRIKIQAPFKKPARHYKAKTEIKLVSEQDNDPKPTQFLKDFLITVWLLILFLFVFGLVFLPVLLGIFVFHAWLVGLCITIGKALIDIAFRILLDLTKKPAKKWLLLPPYLIIIAGICLIPYIYFASLLSAIILAFAFILPLIILFIIMKVKGLKYF